MDQTKLDLVVRYLELIRIKDTMLVAVDDPTIAELVERMDWDTYHEKMGIAFLTADTWSQEELERLVAYAESAIADKSRRAQLASAPVARKAMKDALTEALEAVIGRDVR